MLSTIMLKVSDWFYIVCHMRRQWNEVIDPNSRMKKLSNLLVDVSLGLLMYMLFLKGSDANEATSVFLSTAEHTNNRLKELLKWLMGAPAGLKLNHELTYFLGTFFTHHVDLWLTYLHMVRSLLPVVTNMLRSSCIFGLSFYLTLCNDVINMLTFHVYCFYVYAAKLYYYQLKGIRVLFKLFTGKEWNVLRLRVDSKAYLVDQLIMGTILFTVLLFSFPTTLVYYIVFTFTRLIVLLSQTLISGVIEIIVRFPVTDLWRRVWDSNFITEKLELEYKINDIDADLLRVERKRIQYKVSYKKVGCTDIMKTTYNFQVNGEREMIQKLLTGVIVRPWR